MGVQSWSFHENLCTTNKCKEFVDVYIFIPKYWVDIDNMPISFQLIEYIEYSLQNFRAFGPIFALLRLRLVRIFWLHRSALRKRQLGWSVSVAHQFLKRQSGKRQPLGRGSIGHSKRSIAVGGCPRFLAILAQRSAICGTDLCPVRHPPQRLLQVTKNLQKIIDETCNRTGSECRYRGRSQRMSSVVTWNSLMRWIEARPMFPTDG